VSFEMPSDVTLWTLGAQLIGRKRLPETREGTKEAVRAINWLNEKFVMWDFLGIGDWKELLRAFRYGKERMGVELWVLDSMMRTGIADDDYATQGFMTAAMSTLCKETGQHGFIIVHENKGEGKGKDKIRGSALIRANVDNITGVQINKDKGQKVAKLRYQIATEKLNGQPPNENYIRDKEEELDKAIKEWDTRFILYSQRYSGSQQNGARYVFFDPECFQFRQQWQDPPVNWLERWKREQQPAASTPDPPDTFAGV